MEFLTLNTGAKMPVEGFGVFQIPDAAQCEQVVYDAIKTGYRLLDTAAAYMNEEALGKGVANFYPAILANLCENVEVIPAVNQVELHPFFTQEAALENMKAYGVVPQAWGPLAEGKHGIFTDPELTEIGRKYGKSAAQVVLRWNAQRGVSIIPKSVHVERMEQNIDIWDFSLTEDEMKKIAEKDLGHSEIVNHEDPGMKTILIVEDEKDIAEMLSVFLENEGYRTVSAYDGLEGLRLFGKERADLVILDILLPKLDGFSLCKEIRRKSDVPMIMLTALSDEDSQIKGYDLMIDEYVTKPFSIGVFLKKVAAVLRRRENPRTELLSWGDISMDRESHTVKVKEQEVYLTGREFELLALFLADPHRIMTKDYIMEKLWKYEYGCEDGIIYTHIKNLRKKIGEDVIKTIRGVGYKLD